MSIELGQPPMVEALCEFVFASETWDWTIPGRFSARVAEDYPLRREKHIAKVTLNDQTQDATGPYRILLLDSENVSRAVQLGNNWLGVHRMPPYEDWAAFKTQIETTLALYREIAQPEKLVDVNLYFRHQIMLPTEGAPLPTLLPQFPADTSLGYQYWMAWQQSIAVDRREKRGIATLQSGAFFDPAKIPPRFIAVDVQRGIGVGVMLNLQFGFNDENALQWEELSDWLDTAHEELGYLWAHSASEQLMKMAQEATKNEHP